MTNLSTLTDLTGYAIPENSAATPGLWNRPLTDINLNLQTLNAAAGLIAVGGSGVSRYVNVAASPYLATGLGSASEHTRFAAAVSDVTTNGGYLLVPPGTYKFTSVATLSCPMIVESGATIWGSGVTVPVSGYVVAGPWSWVSGSVLITSPQPVVPQWWGVTGDGTTDDAAAWNRIQPSLTTHAVIYIPPGTRSVLGSTVTLSNAEDLTLHSPQWPRQASSWNHLASAFSWSGPVGGVMLSLDRCRYTTVEGLMFWPNNRANKAILIDGYDASAYGSQCRISKFGISNQGDNANFVGVDISPTAMSNQEYHEIQDGTIYCSAGPDPVQMFATSTSSSSIIVGSFLTAWSGRTFRMALAGPANGLWTTTLSSVTTTTRAMASSSASFSVTSAQAIVGQTYGTAIRVGNSANAKAIRIRRMIFQLGARAIEAQNGSINVEDCSATQFEQDIRVTGASEPTSIVRWNTESARQAVHFDVGLPFHITDCRFGTQSMLPMGSYIDFVSNTHTGAVEFCQFDNLTPSGSKMYGLASCQAQSIDFRSNRYSSSGETTGSLGWTDLPSPYGITAKGEVNVTDLAPTGGTLEWRRGIMWKSDARSYDGLPNSAPTDSNIDNSQFSPWLDETNKNLVFRVRNSAGVLSTSSLSIK